MNDSGRGIARGQPRGILRGKPRYIARGALRRITRGGLQRTKRGSGIAAVVLMASGVAACGGEGEGPVIRLTVPDGASFSQVADSLEAKGIVNAPSLFRVYARITGSTDEIKAGTYGFRRGAGWETVLDAMEEGRILTLRFVIPEGWNLRAITARAAALTGASERMLMKLFMDPEAATRFAVPGPTLEGYLYPATYVLPVDLTLDMMVERMVREYHEIWTPLRRARADSIGMTEREVVTLASIIETEATIADEMPTISAVFHNRLRIGYPLQADPTVQYALEEHQAHLLYAHIESVAENPYNTYTHPGLPPGPIASPSVSAIDAALMPADVDYLYFVARPDGHHIFTHSLKEHNRAKNYVDRLRSGDARARAQPS